jgi:hypothetical protein
MLGLRTVLAGTGTSSARALRAAMAPDHTNLKELLQVALIHHRYMRTWRRTGPFGHPVSAVLSTGALALRG